jgi:DNA gyrase subunit A
VVLATREGMSIRFHQGDVRDMGRVATGVKGIELEKSDALIGMWSSGATRRCWW